MSDTGHRKTDIRAIFDDISLSVISFLENHSGVTDVHFFERPGLTANDLAKWEQYNYPCTLPDDYKAFLMITDGWILRWHIKYLDETIPLGCMQLNQLSQVKPIDASNYYDDTSNHSSTQPPVMAFDLDSTCLDGRLALFYNNGAQNPQIWFQDLSCTWHFIANTFTDYFRLMIMHLGLPHWQYAFTNVGLDPASKQWFRFLSPERLAIDIENWTQRDKDSVTSTPSVPAVPATSSGALPKPGTEPKKLNLSKIDRTAKFGRTKPPKKKSDKSQNSARGGSGSTATGAPTGGDKRPLSAPQRRPLGGPGTGSSVSRQEAPVPSNTTRPTSAAASGFVSGPGARRLGRTSSMS
eukprot:GFYU01004649.1.p1 GENE.GFYU01004649.1~~GFYU01004649.1.p1  ORF type:complete len:352 (-),score=47.71 GFYU01004649.1:117-1172(-)